MATTGSRSTSTSAGVHWTIDPATGNAARSVPRSSAKELETCGIWHSRSAKFAEGWRPGQQLLDTHLPTHYRLPLTTEQRQLYEKMRRCGVERSAVLAASKAT